MIECKPLFDLWLTGTKKEPRWLLATDLPLDMLEGYLGIVSSGELVCFVPSKSRDYYLKKDTKDGQT